MTSPVHVPSTFEGEFYLPNDSQKRLSISPKYEEGSRIISLISTEDTMEYEEDIILVPYDHLEFEGDYDETSILREFRKDNIEFI